MKMFTRLKSGSKKFRQLRCFLSQKISMLAKKVNIKGPNKMGLALLSGIVHPSRWSMTRDMIRNLLAIHGQKFSSLGQPLPKLAKFAVFSEPNCKLYKTVHPLLHLLPPYSPPWSAKLKLSALKKCRRKNWTRKDKIKL